MQVAVRLSQLSPSQFRSKRVREEEEEIHTKGEEERRWRQIENVAQEKERGMRVSQHTFTYQYTEKRERGENLMVGSLSSNGSSLTF